MSKTIIRLLAISGMLSGLAFAESHPVDRTVGNLIYVQEPKSLIKVIQPRHIQEIIIEQTKNGSYYATIYLKDQAADRFEEYTRAHVGQKLDILVLGRIIDAPTIKAAVDTGIILVENLTEAEAAALRRF